MKYEVKSFLLKIMMVLFGLLGMTQLGAFAGGECSFLQMLMIAPVCAVLCYEACKADAHITREKSRRVVALRVAQREPTSRFVA
ncbi:MAG: hypothetical protein RR867_06505 [Ruthenibacterium sp.]